MPSHTAPRCRRRGPGQRGWGTIQNFGRFAVAKRGRLSQPIKHTQSQSDTIHCCCWHTPSTATSWRSGKLRHCQSLWIAKGHIMSTTGHLGGGLEADTHGGKRAPPPRGSGLQSVLNRKVVNSCVVGSPRCANQKREKFVHAQICERKYVLKITVTQFWK